MRPWRPAPWPGIGRMTLRCTRPLAIVLALSSSPPVRGTLVWPLWIVWLVALLAGIAAPVWIAGAMSRASEPRATRRGAARRVWVPAVAFNLLAAAAALAVFGTIL